MTRAEVHAGMLAHKVKYTILVSPSLICAIHTCNVFQKNLSHLPHNLLVVHQLSHALTQQPKTSKSVFSIQVVNGKDTKYNTNKTSS